MPLEWTKAEVEYFIPGALSRSWASLEETTDGVVELVWCWRCERPVVHLLDDPMIGDYIGLCPKCVAERIDKGLRSNGEEREQ